LSDGSRLQTSLRAALRLVDAAGLLVPAAQRREWREQWCADLLHRAGVLERSGDAGGAELPRRALGAFAHAAWLLRREWRVGAMMQDVRYGLRSMRRRPGFTLVAMLVAGLGIGANATIFSWVRALLLDPLPGVAEPGRLVALNGVEGDRRELSFSWPNFVDVETQLPPSLSGVLASRPVPLSVRLGDRPERVWGALVGGEFFEVLGVEAARGRTFRAEEKTTPETHAVAVVGHSFWQERLGGREDAIGGPLTINGHTFTVVGVMPPSFRGAEAAFGLDVYVPMMMQEAIVAGKRLEERGNGWLHVLGRLAPGATHEQAQAELDVVAARLAAEYPVDEGRGMAVFPLWRAPSSASSVLAPVLAVLAGLVGVVLLIACVNIASLLLARAAAREREVAVRLAVGASRGRLVRQLLTESVLLAIAGGLAGIAMAAVTSRALVGLLPPTPFPVEIRTGVSLPLLVFGALLSILTGVLFGLAPALQATRSDLMAGLKQSAGALGGGRRPARLRQTLVVGQLALSMLLLVSAGLFLRTLWNARALDPGYAEDRGILASLDLQPAGYDEEAGRAFHAELLRRIEALPGVRAASLATHVPLSLGGGSDTSGSIEGYQPREDEHLVLFYNKVSPGYFDTLGVPIVEGRGIDERDTADAPDVVVINETMARRYWQEGEALGGRVTLGDRTLEVVGIARDGRYLRLNEEARNYMYLPLSQYWGPETTLQVATEVDPRSVLTALHRSVASLDPELPLFDVRTLAEHRRLAVYLQDLTATLLGAFGLLALALAAVGVYGVVAQSVSRRTQEIGLRMALVASRAEILRLVLSQGARFVAVGLALGGAAALAVAPLFGSQLVGVGAADPASFAATAVVLAAAALAACALPARRGAAIEPVAALREE
jgi:putative ABC transport system permease protein